jgi:hypothetical protein
MGQTYTFEEAHGFFAVVLFGSNPPQLSHHIAFLASLLVFLLFSVAGTACLSKLMKERGWNPIRRQRRRAWALLAGVQISIMSK